MSDDEKRVAAVMIAAVEHHQAQAGQVAHARRKEIAMESRAFVAMYDALRAYDANRATMRDLPPFRVPETEMSSDDPDRFVFNMVDALAKNRRGHIAGIDPDEKGAEVVAAIEGAQSDAFSAALERTRILTEVLQEIESEKCICDCAAKVRRMLEANAKT